MKRCSSWSGSGSQTGFIEQLQVIVWHSMHFDYVVCYCALERCSVTIGMPLFGSVQIHMQCGESGNWCVYLKSPQCLPVIARVPL
jgi:hypothetical protein